MPSATVIIAADHILMGGSALTLTTPDKIFILALAIAILITYTMLSYRLEAKKTETEAEDITPAMYRLLDLSRLVIPEEGVYQQELEATRLIEYCDEIHQGNEPLPNLEDVHNETLKKIAIVEKTFAEKVGSNKKGAYQQLYLAMCACDNHGWSDDNIDNSDTPYKEYLKDYCELNIHTTPLHHEQIKQSIKRAALESTYQDTNLYYRYKWLKYFLDHFFSSLLNAISCIYTISCCIILCWILSFCHVNADIYAKKFYHLWPYL